MPQHKPKSIRNTSTESFRSLKKGEFLELTQRRARLKIGTSFGCFAAYSRHTWELAYLIADLIYLGAHAPRTHLFIDNYSLTWIKPPRSSATKYQSG
jgi:hypothetical protein